MHLATVQPRTTHNASLLPCCYVGRVQSPNRLDAMQQGRAAAAHRAALQRGRDFARQGGGGGGRGGATWYIGPPVKYNPILGKQDSSHL